MAITKDQKTQIVDEMKDKLQKATSVVFARNNGLSVSAITDLRKQLREQGIDSKVAKKTLLKIAAKENGIDDIPNEVMEGPIITFMGYEDQAVPAKIIADFAKSSDDKIELMGGILDNEVIPQAKVKYLASLPSREELIAKLMGSMNAPVSNFVGVLNQVPSSFVRVINAYKEKREQEGEAA